MGKTFLDGTATLAESNLALSLNATCRALASAIVRGGAKLDEHMLNYEIPGRVLQVAIRARWLKRPSKPKAGGSSLNGVVVSNSYREELMELLEPVYDELKLRDYGGWAEPTPRQYLKRFKRSSGYTDEELAFKASEFYETLPGEKREGISVKTIRRIQNSVGHNANPRVLRAIAAAMGSRPGTNNYFASIKWYWLQWRPSDSEPQK